MPDDIKITNCTIKHQRVLDLGVANDMIRKLKFQCIESAREVKTFQAENDKFREALELSGRAARNALRYSRIDFVMAVNNIVNKALNDKDLQ